MAKGKYSDVLGKLARAPEESKRAAEIQAEVERLRSGPQKNERGEQHWPARVEEVPRHEVQLPEKPTTADLAREYRRLRSHEELVSAAVSRLALLKEAMTQMIDLAYEAAGITSLKLDDGRSVSSQPEPIGSVEDREAFRQWCLENGLEQSLALPWQTMTAIVKEKLLEGHVCVLGNVEVFDAEQRRVFYGPPGEAFDFQVTYQGGPTTARPEECGFQEGCVVGVRAYYRPKLVLR
jgi:hypothetical protein